MFWHKKFNVLCYRTLFCDIDKLCSDTKSFVVVKSLSCIQLFCSPMDCSPPGSSAHGISQARILERVSTPPPGDFPNPGMIPYLLHLLHCRGILYHWATSKPSVLRIAYKLVVGSRIKFSKFFLQYINFYQKKCPPE